MEENDRMGKTRDLLEKIGETKGTLHTKRGTIKDRNGMDLTEAEVIKKRWQEHIEELYKRGLNDLDNNHGIITHLEPDILDFSQIGLRELLWTKLEEVMKFQLSYFKS